MKNKLSLSIIIILFTINLMSQNISKSFGGEYLFYQEKNTCLTKKQRSYIKKTLKNNIVNLKKNNSLIYKNQKNTQQVFFNWPIKQANGFSYNDIWAISGYVDHNTAFPNQLIDYNCGTKTYDTSSGYNHQGVDIYLWPFSWKMMDDNQAEIIAAQSGQIIGKTDGNFDRSCNFNNNQWNSIYVIHSDGSVAWYGHMKNGSLTSKNIGDTVNQGEFLGIVGSSGNSTGPHLHFEVYDSNNNLIDPYYGNCNSLNSSTWWNQQKPYNDPNINAVLTHTAPPNFNTCPTAETTNISNDFVLNDNVYYAVYLRDQIANTVINLKITRPDNSIFTAWNFTLTDNFTSSYWYWWNNNDMIGTWKWEVTYQGQTEVHYFNVTSALNTTNNKINNLKVFPNPFNNKIKISSNENIVKASIFDPLGKKVLSLKNDSKLSFEINTNKLSNGLYFLILESDLNKKETIKIIKK